MQLRGRPNRRYQPNRAYQARFTQYVSPSSPSNQKCKRSLQQRLSNDPHHTRRRSKVHHKGINLWETPMSVKGQVYLACRCVTATNSNTTGTETAQAQQQPAQPTKCPAQLAAPQDLRVHILKDHLSPARLQAAGTSKAPLQLGRLRVLPPRR